MILNIMREVKRFWEVSSEDGEFVIEDGILTGNEYMYPVGSYIAITGSLMNNNVYLITDDKITLENTTDEEFEGTIYQLAPPRDFLELVEEIKRFQETQGTPSINISERFGTDSRTKATGKNGAVLTWRDVFQERLRPYRKSVVMPFKI